MSVAIDPNYVLPLTALGAFCVCSYFAWRDFRYARALADTPTAKIRSAPQGYVELVGRAESGPRGETVAPLSGSPCLWYRYLVEKKDGKGRWSTLHRGVSEQPFKVLDDTGECHVYPQGADVVRTRSRTWRGDDPMYQHHPQGGLVSSLRGAGQFLDSLSFGGKRYRYTECRISSGDPLHALGYFRTLGGSAALPDRRAELGKLLEGWKQDHQRMALFDRDGDGQLSPREWDAAVAAAQSQLDRDRLQRPEEPRQHTLSNHPQPGRPFLLSTAPESRLVRGYQIRAAAAAAGIAVSGGYLALLIG